MSATVLGLIGGIASGKSSVADLFEAERSCTRIDADVLARRVLNSPTVQRALRERFPRMVGPDGSFDRKQMASLVFQKPAQLAALEAILHPPILRGIRSAIARARTEYVLLDAPLLLETGLDRLCDALVYVACPARVRRRRAASNRGWSEDEHRQREAHQWSLRRKRARAEFIVNNGSTPAIARRDVRRILRRIEG